MCLYVTVVMYLHVSAMSVESRCFPQFLLRSLGGILGDSWGMRQSEAPNAKLTLRTFGGFEGFIWQSDRLWQIFAALHGTFNKLLMFRNVCCGLEGGLNCKASWVRGKCSKMHPLQPKTLLPVWVHQMNSVQAWKASWCWMLPYDAKHPRSVPIRDGRRLTKMWGKNLQLIAPTKGSAMSAAA